MNDSKRNIRELTLYLCKPLMIINIILMPFILYFFLIGLFVDGEAFMYGIGILLIFIILLIIMFGVYFLYKISDKKIFELNSNKDIEYSICFYDGKYMIENINKKTINKVSSKNIKKIKVLKNIIFIKSSFGSSFYVPKTKELLEFFGK